MATWIKVNRREEKLLMGMLAQLLIMLLLAFDVFRRSGPSGLSGRDSIVSDGIC